MKEGRDHDDAEDQDADGFEAATADWIGVTVLPGDEEGGGPDDGGGEEVEGCVDERGQDREGGREYDDGDLGGKKDDIGDEVDVDSYCYDAR